MFDLLESKADDINWGTVATYETLETAELALAIWERLCLDDGYVSCIRER
jgi:hypothetical protein